ncbi:WecB/TagA/CpsF family glycosyltransferase [Sphingomonas sp. RHCKR7]|uniref:WecB/TagA/CpsF family glycosyltransferase n=1 Tax=Sphingomonas folli TaxID=2862497 RepID=UPI001C67642B|nr:WecB/TagA/CpsF family glycosyltransferase [Sphingomonas folli]MBW6526688.1 WecB/TagA/CpsF family glycosyltransferase [Sphingomonas folli]
MRTEPGPTRGFLGLRFDPLDTDAAVTWLRAARADSPFAYVVTPNVDHIVRLDAAGREEPTGAALWRAYEGAALTLCDSRVLARLARWCGVTLPVAPGSDLTVRLFDEVARPGDRIAIIGGDSTLLAALRERFAALDIVQHVPPMGLLRDAAALEAAAAFGRDSRARFLLLAVGSPQQEIVAARIAALAGAGGVALCIGASLDFIVGRQRRAPRLVQRLGLEWAHRLASQPRRLWRRYLVEGPRIFRLARSWRAGRDSFAPD